MHGCIVNGSGAGGSGSYVAQCGPSGNGMESLTGTVLFVLASTSADDDVSIKYISVRFVVEASRTSIPFIWSRYR